MKSVEKIELTSSEISVVVSAIYSRINFFCMHYSSNEMLVYKSTRREYLELRSSLRKLGYGYLLNDLKLKRFI